MASSTDAADKKMIVLQSSDGEIFEVEVAVALQSQTIKYLLEDVCDNSTIPLPNVTSEILAKVIEYCRRHVAVSTVAKADDELEAFDKDFVNVDQVTLFELLLAANYLNMEGLVGLTCQAVADMMKRKTPEEIRKIFNIKNDFTPEEEEKILRENAWAFN